MTTVTTRLAIDVLRSARVRREPTRRVAARAAGRGRGAVRGRGRGIGVARVARPARAAHAVERAVLVLRDSFDLPFTEIAAISTRPRTTAARSSAAPAAAWPTGEPRFDADPVQRRALGLALPGRGPRGRPRRPGGAARAGRGPDRRRRRWSPTRSRARFGAAADRPHPSSGSTARSTRGASRSSRFWVNGQPGFRTLDADGLLVNVAVGFDSLTAGSSPCTPSSIRTSSPTSARCRTWRCARRCADTPSRCGATAPAGRPATSRAGRPAARHSSTHAQRHVT